MNKFYNKLDTVENTIRNLENRTEELWNSYRRDKEVEIWKKKSKGVEDTGVSSHRCLIGLSQAEKRAKGQRQHSK